MTRKKVTAEPILRNWNEVDDSLKLSLQLDLEIERIKNRMTEEINRIKNKYEALAEPLISKKMRVEKDLEDYCEFYREHFEQQRTRILNYGKVGFRKSRELGTLKGWTWKKVLAKLKELGRLEFVRITEGVKRDAIRQADLDDKVLKTFGCYWIEKDEFWFEPDKEAVAKLEKKFEVIRKSA